MRILALDLGTKTGWALLSDSKVTSGTWTLATAKQIKNQRKENKGWDARPGRLREHLLSFHPAPEFVYYEDVQFASTTLQAHLWGGFRAIVSLLHPPCVIRAVPVGTLKKFASGNGMATKEMMIAALPKEIRDLDPDDNQADAYHLLRFAMKELNVCHLQN